jgi:cytosine/adenosine deaminase-related metal-dependent hydrolase
MKDANGFRNKSSPRANSGGTMWKSGMAPGAEVIDGDGMIVLPGLVETHWHMWNTLLRSIAVDERKFGYFPTSAGLGQHYLPSDM